MPEGKFGFPRLTSVGPFVSKTWEDVVDQTTPDVDVFFKSSEDMSELDDRSVHLAVTSPPYNIGWDYGDFEDDKNFQEYKGEMRGVMDETYRVLERQGRLCLVVPTLVRAGPGGGFSHLQLFLNIAQEMDRDWREREVIIWDKGSGRPPSYGTFPEPWGILFTNIHECILILQKPGRRRSNRRPPEEIREVSEWDKKDQELTQDVWRITPQDQVVSVKDESVPTYPREIPRRLIKHYSYVTDTVLDPFAGVGTTLGVAVREGRNAVGYELRPQLTEAIKEELGINLEMEGFE